MAALPGSRYSVLIALCSFHVSLSRPMRLVHRRKGSREPAEASGWTKWKSRNVPGRPSPGACCGQTWALNCVFVCVCCFGPIDYVFSYFFPTFLGVFHKCVVNCLKVCNLRLSMNFWKTWPTVIPWERTSLRVMWFSEQFSLVTHFMLPKCQAMLLGRWTVVDKVDSPCAQRGDVPVGKADKKRGRMQEKSRETVFKSKQGDVIQHCRESS